MIPVSLTIKGLYSYQSEQKIEFDRLLEGQLFGIFGSVGSGKSSILEAMTFALYGQSERLDRNDNRNYNMMNLKSDDLLIDFIFRSFDEQEYRFTVRGKRNGKDFAKVNTFDRAAYKKSGAGWQPLESSNADEILGLSYDNFRRTVIIPQGKFQEFLQLGDKARTDMLKEIFQLDKYEFFYQTAALEKKNNEAIQLLDGQLIHYHEVNAEGIAAKEIAVNQLNEKLKEERDKLQKAEALVKEQQALKQLFNDLAIQRNKLDELLLEQEFYTRHSRKITDYEFCLRNFKEGLKRKKELEEGIKRRTSLIAESTDVLKNSTDQFDHLQKRYEAVKLDFQKQEERRLLVEDYRHILSLITIRSEIHKQRQRLADGKPHLDKALSEKTGSEQRIAELKEKIRAQKAIVPDMAILSAVKAWHTERKGLERHHEGLRSELTEIEKQSSDLPAQLTPHLTHPSFQHLEINQPFEYYVEHIDRLREENGQSQKALAAHVEHLRVQLRLGEFAGQLSQGGACLLCGSEHHPNLLVVDDVNEHLSKAELQAQEHNHSEKSCGQLLQLLHGFQQTQKSINQQSEGLKKRIGDEETRLKEHTGKFMWEAFDPVNEGQVNELFLKFDLETQKLKEFENDLDQAEKACQDASAAYEKYRKAIDVIQSAIISKESEEATLARQLKSVKESDYKVLPESELQTKIDVLVQLIEASKLEFEQLTEQLDSNRDVRTALLERIKTNQEVLEKDESQIREIKSSLQECFEKSAFSNWEEVEQILNEELDIDKLKVDVANYQQQLYVVKQILAQLENQASGKSFNDDSFELALAKLEQHRLGVQAINDEYVNEKSSFDRQKKDFEQKNHLQAQLDKLQKRAANLATMKQLFKGSGFVNYVSSVYLHQLCESANERFYKLTRQSLRLEVTDRNEFQVRDFLNNGKVRNVKTLSGGQTFQASLSLALALAESVQQQNKSKQNFFFLDEGFGSLDKESLQVAFETLKSLRKENRIVGIISHVDELQQEIDVFLNVTNDHFSGSSIKGSWEN